MGHDEKKLREWLREFCCENAYDALADAGFDSLGMISSLDEEEMQMLEIVLKDLPPVKQRRIIKKVEELAGNDMVHGIEEPVWPVSSEIRFVSTSNALPEPMMPIVPVQDDTDDSDETDDDTDDADDKMTSQVDSNATTAASSLLRSGDPSLDILKAKMAGAQEDTSVRVNNFLTTTQESGASDSAGTGLVHKPPPATPRRIDEVHPLPQIALVGALLCLNSGWVNGVGFRGFDGGVTHVTGTATKIGLNIARPNAKYALKAAAKVLAFMFGGMLSGGYLGRGRLFKGGPRYAHLLLVVSAATFAAFGAEKSEQNYLGMLLLVTSSGMLNAVTSLYTGQVLKTATITSTVTDIGCETGFVLFQDDRHGLWKLYIKAAFVVAYIIGGFLGAFCFDPEAISGPDFVRAEAQALLVPATALLAMAIAWLASLRGAEPDPGGHGFFAEVSWRTKTPRDNGEIMQRNVSKNSLYAKGAIAAAA
jgi:uncharacterized membrane protein YoaK (UPF0700 family)